MFSFHHVALSVSDIELSTTFYQALGFKPAMQWQAEDNTLRISHLKLGDALLELFCYPQPQTAPGTTNELASDLPRIGIKHFGLQVEDIQQARLALDELGLLNGAAITHGRTGIDYLFIRDPDGIFVEVVEDGRGL